MPMAIDPFHWLGLDYVFNPQKRLYWGYLLSTAAIALFYCALKRQSIAGSLDKKTWWHPSARLDYSYFIVASIIKTSLILPWMLGVGEVTYWTLQLMETLLGYQEKIMIDRQWIVLSYTLALFLLSDLSRYCLHRLMHAVPLLWKFHQIHHSAEVLTPITFYRVHPLENLLFGLRYALVSGLISGIFIHFYGANLAILDIIGVNAIVFSFHLLGDNLRHSGVHLGYFKTLEKWFISPAQHQFHHTITGTTVNYGGVLALWDRLFGSLRLSDPEDHYHYGLDETTTRFGSVWQLLSRPFLSFKKEHSSN